MAEAAGGGPPLPEELIIWEILTRLPAKPVLRCRAVCRSWRRCLTSDAKFLLAHHRRQPSFPLVTTSNDQERRIDALDHRTGERRPVARTDRTTTAEDLDVLASCDGLLILIAYGGLYICNPTARQLAPLPLFNVYCISGLYPHPPFRVVPGALLREDGRPRRVPRAHRRVRRPKVHWGAPRGMGVRGYGEGDAHDGVLSATRPGGRQALLESSEVACRWHRQGQQHAGVRHHSRVLPACAVARGGPFY
uniref:Uncharacterized protein n=1 Tax=Avena sativa TaxID=4498 RepID=A0ACD6AF31_AVESA